MGDGDRRQKGDSSGPAVGQQRYCTELGPTETESAGRTGDGLASGQERVEGQGVAGQGEAAK